MSDDSDLNDRGNHQAHFSQSVGGWAEYTVYMTDVSDEVRHDVTVPPGKVIPVIFLPGVMGSNLRMSKERQAKLDRDDNRAWRPDHMVDLGGKFDVVTGRDLGGWFKNASPAQRQLNFDPNETEVEYYHYTENNERFDPEGAETLMADGRHQNVPDAMPPIPPLLAQPPFQATAKPAARGVTRKFATPAQVARWRGWSEVLFAGSYGKMLKTTEAFLNNIVVAGRLGPMWQRYPTTADGKPLLAPANRGLTDLLLKPPTAFGASAGEAISESDLKKIAPCWYPVHAMGYNFLKSNGQSAIAIAERIRGLVLGYQKRHFKCDEVIIVTHSMGGLVGRALLHPKYGNLLADGAVKVLGMYHGVMPATGAAAAYKRMRFGFQERSGYIAENTARIFGIDGKHATAILANTPGPLELLPGAAYGQGWVKLIDHLNFPVQSWPSGSETALKAIYLQESKNWWRLVNPEWVNPGAVTEENGGGIEQCYVRLGKAYAFLQSIDRCFHPTNSWASYCSSKEHVSYGEVVFKIMDVDIYRERLAALPPPQKWQLLSEDAKGKLMVQAGARKLTLQLLPSAAPGDETVPSERSARQIRGQRFVHGEGAGDGYEHQDSYSNPQVLASMLYSIVQIAKSGKWE